MLKKPVHKNSYKIKLPLLKDNHTHTFTYAALYNSPSLVNVLKKESAVKIIRDLDNDKINVLLGWNAAKYNFSKVELANFPPVVICNVSLHSYIINSSAKEILNEINHEIIDNIENQTWVEQNLTKIISFIASLREFDEKKIAIYFNELEKLGVWYAEDMYVSNTKIIKYYGVSKYHDRTALWTDVATYISLPDNLKKQIKGIKIFTDGAIGARSAALKKDYIPSGNGLLIYSNDELLNLLILIRDINKPVAIHAIGDKAIEQTTFVLQKICRGWKDYSIRVEHCQLISEETAIKLKKLGIILSMQPNFTVDSVQYADRLPVKYLKQNNPFRMLIDKAGFVPGKDLIFGSDGMPHGIKFALEQSLFPPYKNQQLKLEEFIAGYCMPNMDDGYVDVEIDEINRDVKINCSLTTSNS